MNLRALLIGLLVSLVAGCGSDSRFVGTWRTKDGADIVTMSLLKDGSGHFVADIARNERYNTAAKTVSAPIKKWWVDNQAFRYINHSDKEQAMKIVSIEPNVLTLEEPLGSGHISIYERVR